MPPSEHRRRTGSGRRPPDGARPITATSGSKGSAAAQGFRDHGNVPFDSCDVPAGSWPAWAGSTTATIGPVSMAQHGEARLAGEAFEDRRAEAAPTASREIPTAPESHSSRCCASCLARSPARAIAGGLQGDLPAGASPSKGSSMKIEMAIEIRPADQGQAAGRRPRSTGELSE